MLGAAIALLETLPSRERRHVPAAAICSGWTAQHRAGSQIQIGLIDFRGSEPAIHAAAFESTAAVQNQFLMHPSHHDLTVNRRKPDVGRQPHTVLCALAPLRLCVKISPSRCWCWCIEMACGDSAERRHFEFSHRRSADAPLRSRSLRPCLLM